MVSSTRLSDTLHQRLYGIKRTYPPTTKAILSSRRNSESHALFSLSSLLQKRLNSSIKYHSTVKTPCKYIFLFLPVSAEALGQVQLKHICNDIYFNPSTCSPKLPSCWSTPLQVASSLPPLSNCSASYCHRRSIALVYFSPPRHVSSRSAFSPCL